MPTDKKRLLTHDRLCVSGNDVIVSQKKSCAEGSLFIIVASFEVFRKEGCGKKKDRFRLQMGPLSFEPNQDGATGSPLSQEQWLSRIGVHPTGGQWPLKTPSLRSCRCRAVAMAIQMLQYLVHRPGWSQLEVAWRV